MSHLLIFFSLLLFLFVFVLSLRKNSVAQHNGPENAPTFILLSPYCPMSIRQMAKIFRLFQNFVVENVLFFFCRIFGQQC